MDPLTKAGRTHAAPMLQPKSGLPLIKSVPSLGRMRVWLRGLSKVPVDMPEEDKKKKVYQDFLIFKAWMEKEEDAHFKGEVRISRTGGHIDFHEPDTQYGDNGGKRKVARSLARDSADPEYEDYEIRILCDVPERITELPTDLANELFDRPGGRKGLRPLREREWKQRGNRWSQRS